MTNTVTLTGVRKPLALMAIAGALLTAAAGIAAADPPGTDAHAPAQPSGSPHTVVTYGYDGYPQYSYVYTDPAPAQAPAPANRLADPGQDRTWQPVSRPDGSGWTVCRLDAATC
ncbi:hypothetical protein D7D52_23920 [Nocardia yunnanensis]|uniref:Uncharacterized protein n=1 Tax=Nocardia yunnanensis TaxID=2382165 RepID=A0A386ZIH1_9NOCA|nr:hypothetical protein [Nocardia yunnanensis]AYF76369.1 hypothetical protein D7D52_23920 [Nocardia yunnanensis]